LVDSVEGAFDKPVIPVRRGNLCPETLGGENTGIELGDQVLAQLIGGLFLKFRQGVLLPIDAEDLKISREIPDIDFGRGTKGDVRILLFLEDADRGTAA
jgi:hypothetical protein